MKRAILLISLMFILFQCSPTTIVKISFTEKFEGQTQLVLASQTANIDFIEDVSKSLLVFLKSDARVKVTSNVTYDFYVDFLTDEYNATLDKKENVLYFEAPPIRVKKPVINASTVSYPETGILVNEQQEAIRILETLTDNFIGEGLALLDEPKVMAMCTEKLQDYMMGLTKEFGYKVDRVDVTFKELEAQQAE